MEKLLVSIKKFKVELKLHYFSSRLHPVVMVQLKSGIWMIRYSFFVLLIYFCDYLVILNLQLFAFT